MRLMKSLKARCIAPSALLMGLAGCGTLGNMIPGEKRGIDNPPPYRIFGGTRLDCEIIGKREGWGHPDLSWFFKPACVIDTPLSLGMDTVTLPITVIITLIRGGEPEGHPEGRDPREP